MSYSHLGQTLSQIRVAPSALVSASSAKPVVVSTSSVVVNPPAGAPARGVVVVSGAAKPVNSADRAKAAAAMAIRIADKLRALRPKAPAGAPRSAMNEAENKIRGIALLLPLKRMTLAQAFMSVSEAQRGVIAGQLPLETRKSVLAALQALRSAIAPPVRSKVTVAPAVGGRVSVTATQATTIQGSVDAAISKLAAAGTPVTEATVKQAAVDIIKEVAPDASEAAKMTASLNESPLVVSGGAKADETKAVETLTTTPMATEAVVAIMESTDKAPPAPEPEATKVEEPAPAPTPSDLVAAPPPAEEKKADEVTSLVAPTEAPKKEGLFGIPWLYVGLGAGALVVGGIIMSRRPAPTPNRRKRGSKRRSR